MKLFPLHLADFYKPGHRAMEPDGTELIYANFTPRSDRLAHVLPDFDHKVVALGLQGNIQWLLIDQWRDEFFAKPLDYVIARFKRRMDGALGVGSIPTDHIAALHGVGYLPLHIKALPEGSRVNMKVPLFTVRNTRPDIPMHFGWLTNYLEDQLSSENWKTVTSATTAFEFRRLLDLYAAKTGSPASFVPWQGHDFSLRGMSGLHDAAQSGMGHLGSFYGTDNIPSLDFADDYYGGTETFLGGSVPASEHSIMTLDGQTGEVQTIRRLMRAYPRGVLSIVSDSWDYWHIITTVAAELKPEIMAREADANGLAKIVFRPDSGDPVKIICGDPHAVPGTPAFKGSVQCLWETFGGTTTGTGHRLLDSHVGLIYGDSITLDRAQRILARLDELGFASANVVFGIGSFTYQHVTRDTFGHAIKATYAVVNGVGREMAKDPITDQGKKSAKGLLRVTKDDAGNFILHDQQTWEQEAQGELRTVFLDGVAHNVETIAQIRTRLHGDKFAG